MLLVPVALLAAACEDSSSTLEPLAEAVEEPADAVEESAAAALLPAGRWADGYLLVSELLVR